jgi:hypothetical protein
LRRAAQGGDAKPNAPGAGGGVSTPQPRAGVNGHRCERRRHHAVVANVWEVGQWRGWERGSRERDDGKRV